MSEESLESKQQRLSQMQNDGATLNSELGVLCGKKYGEVLRSGFDIDEKMKLSGVLHMKCSQLSNEIQEQGKEK